MSKVEITMADGVSYTASVERVIGVGAKFNISPSYGYVGVEDGAVRVMDMVTSEEYAACPHRFPEIEGYLEAAYSNDTIEPGKKDYVPTEYENTIWVVYSYMRSNSDRDRYVFPIDEFASYISDVS